VHLTRQAKEVIVCTVEPGFPTEKQKSENVESQKCLTLDKKAEQKMLDEAVEE
jgi:hypothetical protein